MPKSYDEKQRHRLRIRSKIAKELESPHYRQQRKENLRKKKIEDLTHAELVKAIQEVDFED